MRHAKYVGTGDTFATSKRDMLQNASAAARLTKGGGAAGYGRDGDYGNLDVGEEEEEDDEDNPAAD